MVQFLSQHERWLARKGVVQSAASVVRWTRPTRGSHVAVWVIGDVPQSTASIAWCEPAPCCFLSFVTVFQAYKPPHAYLPRKPPPCGGHCGLICQTGRPVLRGSCYHEWCNVQVLLDTQLHATCTCQIRTGSVRTWGVTTLCSGRDERVCLCFFPHERRRSRCRADHGTQRRGCRTEHVPSGFPSSAPTSISCRVTTKRSIRRLELACPHRWPCLLRCAFVASTRLMHRLSGILPSFLRQFLPPAALLLPFLRHHVWVLHQATRRCATTKATPCDTLPADFVVRRDGTQFAVACTWLPC